MVAGLNYPAEAAPASPGILTFTAVPEGGWSLIQQAKAVYYNGYTYFAWISGGDGALRVASYSHSTDAISTPVQVDSMGGDVDDHNNPGLLVRASDHKLLVFFCLHNGAHMYLSISTTSLDTDPDLGDGFAVAVDLDASIGANDYTYPEAFQTTNGNMYLFYRDQSSSTGRLAYSKSTNSGSTWSARTILMTAASTMRAYWTIHQSGNRIDIMTTDRAPGGDEGVVDLGHMYLDATTDNVYKSDGTQITATKPFAHSELTQVETNLAGILATDGMAGTNPVFGAIQDNGDGTVSGRYYRWDGSSWDKATIYTHAAHPSDRFFAGIAINQADAEEVFTGRYSSGSISELYVYTSGDLGLTWDAGSAVTSGSGNYNWGPISVKNGDATLPVLWLAGTWTDDFTYSQGIKALGR